MSATSWCSGGGKQPDFTTQLFLKDSPCWCKTGESDWMRENGLQFRTRIYVHAAGLEQPYSLLWLIKIGVEVRCSWQLFRRFVHSRQETLLPLYYYYTIISIYLDCDCYKISDSVINWTNVSLLFQLFQLR